MKTWHHYYVYIVKCNDGLYYTGVTNDLERRLWEHNTGYVIDCFTFKRRPVVLMYEQRFDNIKNAIAWEKQLKGWSRKKKEALFNNDWERIKELAKSKVDPVTLRHPEASGQGDNEPKTLNDNVSGQALGDTQAAKPGTTNVILPVPMSIGEFIEG